MDQSGQIPPVLGLYRHHEAAAPHGDNGLLQYPAVGGGGDDPLEDLAALGRRRPHVAADVRQGGAGGVGNHVLLQDGGEDPILQEPVPPQGGDVQQLPGVQRAAVVRPVEALRHGLDAREGRGALQPDHVPGRVRLVLETLYVVHVRLGDQSQGLLPGRGAVGLVRQHPQDRWQLQGADGFIK